MNIQDIINSSKENSLNESGIKMPKGTKAAKIIHHIDFDGVFSAIITYQQLLKQGVPSKNITISGIQYGDEKNKDELTKKFSRSKGQMVALVDFARIPDFVDKPDFWSDHHSPGEVAKPKKTSGKIGAENFKSDASHLALSYAQNIIDNKTLKAIDAIDSASFTNLEDVITLRKDFKEKNRLERLAIICNALLVDSKIVRNNSLMSSFIKKTSPSLVSFYNNIMHYSRLNKVQEEAIKEISKPNPNWEQIEKARNKMPTMAAKMKIVKEEIEIFEDALSDMEEFEKLKKKGNKRTPEEEKKYRDMVNKPLDNVRARREVIAKAQKDKGTMESRGSTIIQRQARMQRYIWTQMNKKGLKHPFVIKMYPTFIQVSVNPELPENIKKFIDLNKIREDVMGAIKNKYGNKYNEWAFNIIEKDSGGHPGITNIAALGTLGIMPKKDREELKILQDFESRLKGLKSFGRGKLSDENKEKLKKARAMLKRKKISEEDKEYYTKLKKILMPTMEEFMPEKAKRIKELLEKKEKYGETRKKIMEEIKEEFIQQFKKRFNASTKIPVMGKNSNVVIPGGKPEFEME